MTAPTKSFTAIADTAIDPDSPITTGLMTNLRDNAEHLEEWLGKDYTAEQNHNHDGVNSALVEVGPNLLRNGSFESGTAGWTFTDSTGGSHATETANDMHGATSMSVVSTILANGGSVGLSNEFIPCAENESFRLVAMIKASVANVSARIEFVWYDDAQASISASQVYDTTNAPTAATEVFGVGLSPSTARFFKIRITGGVPAAGSATGTVYFDGIRVNVWPTVTAGTTYILAGWSAQKTTLSSSLVQLATVVMPFSGVVSTSFDLAATSGATATGRIFLNGVAAGFLRSTTGTSFTTYTQDITVAAGDELEFRAATSNVSLATKLASMLVQSDKPLAMGIYA